MSKLNVCDGHLKHLTDYAKDGCLRLHFDDAVILALAVGDLLNRRLLAKYDEKSFHLANWVAYRPYRKDPLKVLLDVYECGHVGGGLSTETCRQGGGR